LGVTEAVTHFLGRFVAFAAAPIGAVLVLLLITPWSVYFTIPLLLPAGPYIGSSSWSVPIANSIAVGAVAAVFTNRMPWRKSWLVFGIVLAGATIATHLSLNLLGYKYFMETP